MKIARQIFAAIVALAAAAGLAAPAQAQLGPSSIGSQFNPNWTSGYVPTTFQWALLWSNKLDWYPNGLPIALGGCGAVNATQCLANLGGAPATTGTSLLYGNGIGGFSNATVGLGLDFTTGTLTAPVMTATVRGIVPTPPNDTTKFLNGAGAFTSPVGTTYSNGTGLDLTGTVFSLHAPVTVALGGTNCTAASGTCLDNISGLATAGFMVRTGAGAYTTQSATNGVTLANLAQTGTNTVLGNFTGSTANIAANAMPSCPDSTGNHLNYVSGTGIICGTTSSTTVTPGLIYKFGLSNDSGSPNSVIDIAAGVASDSTNSVSIVGTTFTKSTAGSWAAGSGANGMGSGLTIANSTWYHLFAIINAGAFDAYIDTSITAANKPASTTAFRRIGSFKTDGSAHIVKFTQTGQRVVWVGGSVADFSTASPATSLTSVALSVPPGLGVYPFINALYNAAGSSTLNIADGTFAAAGNNQFQARENVAGTFMLTQFYGMITDTSSQIKYSATSASDSVSINTIGWIDPTLAQY